MLLFSGTTKNKTPWEQQGVVNEDILSDGRSVRVKCLGTFWSALHHQGHCTFVLQEEQPVRLVGKKGTTLLVMPYVSESA
jgi:membrane protein implicated in regulation of membrane protease activity